MDVQTVGMRAYMTAATTAETWVSDLAALLENLKTDW